MKKRLFMVLAAVGLLALLAVPAAVLAQSDEVVYPAYRGLWDVSTQSRVAELLGVTPAELAAQMNGGATLNELAAAKNVSTDRLVGTIVAPHKEMLDLQVKYGRLTALQAQQALDAITARVEALAQTNFATVSAPALGVGAYCPMMGGGNQADPTINPCYSAPVRGGGRGGMMGGGMMGGGMMGSWGW
jgi:hypothetical protein